MPELCCWLSAPTQKKPLSLEVRIPKFLFTFLNFIFPEQVNLCLPPASTVIAAAKTEPEEEPQTRFCGGPRIQGCSPDTQPRRQLPLVPIRGLGTHFLPNSSLKGTREPREDRGEKDRDVCVLAYVCVPEDTKPKRSPISGSGGGGDLGRLTSPSLAFFKTEQVDSPAA